MPKRTQHGGRRPGAGRPPDDQSGRKIRVVMYLTPAELDRLKALGKGSVAAGVRELLVVANRG